MSTGRTSAGRKSIGQRNMARLLLVFPDGPGAFVWARPQAKGRPSFGRATAEQPLSVGGDRVVLLAPGEDVTLHALEAPVRGTAQALAAARFAIEDDLAQPIEEVELSLGAFSRTGRREAVVVDRERLAAWISELAAAGADAESIAPDYAALPREPGVVLAVEHGGRLLVRGEGIGFAVDAVLAPTILAAALARRPDDRIVVRSDRADALQAPGVRDGRRVETLPAPSDDEMIALFAEGLAGEVALDLAPRRRRAAADVRLKDWRLAASLAGAAAAAFVAVLAAETVSLRAHAAAAEADADRIVAQAFPDAASAAGARAALRSGSGAGGAGFLTLSGLLADSVAEVPAMEIEALRFDETGEGLAVSVAFSAYEDVQALRAAVEARGGRLIEGASRMQNGRLLGDVTVERP